MCFLFMHSYRILVHFLLLLLLLVFLGVQKNTLSIYVRFPLVHLVVDRFYVYFVSAFFYHIFNSLLPLCVFHKIADFFHLGKFSVFSFFFLIVALSSSFHQLVLFFGPPIFVYPQASPAASYTVIPFFVSQHLVLILTIFSRIFMCAFSEVISDFFFSKFACS